MFAVGVASYSPIAPTWANVVIDRAQHRLLFNAALLFVSMFFVRLWRRRSAAIEGEAERWEAFRRFLSDFPRLQDAPPASLELWERYLVYGIAFGIAERVLQAAQLQMPEELHPASTVFWISPTGDLGSGPTALGIGDLSAGFGSALAPPSSGSGGGRRRLLRRRRRRRRRWRRRSLVASDAGGARRAPRFRPSRRSATRRRR